MKESMQLNNDDERRMKNLLWEYGVMDERIKDINLQIQLQKETQQSMRGIRSVNMDGLPHSTTIGDPVANAAIKIVDRIDVSIRELLSELNTIYDRQAEFRNMLSCLSPEEYRIIEQRYIKHVRWNYLPSKMHCSRSTCFRIHDIAIKKLFEKNKVGTK